MTETQKIPWKRVAIEASAIVVSILIAFAIDAWWADRKDRQEERDYLTSLRQELIRGSDEVAQREKTHAEIVESHIDLIKQIQSENRASSESLYYMFSLLSRPTAISVPRAVYDDLISSGGSQVIRSDKLRIELALYGATLASFKIENDSVWATWEQRIQPYLEGRIPRLNRIILGSFSRNRYIKEAGWEIPFSLSAHNVDFESVLMDPAFEDMLAERWLRVQDRLWRIRNLQKLMEEIVNMINTEVDFVES